jgi:hypothetical protein
MKVILMNFVEWSIAFTKSVPNSFAEGRDYFADRSGDGQAKS